MDGTSPSYRNSCIASRMITLVFHTFLRKSCGTRRIDLPFAAYYSIHPEVSAFSPNERLLTSADPSGDVSADSPPVHPSSANPTATRAPRAARLFRITSSKILRSAARAGKRRHLSLRRAAGMQFGWYAPRHRRIQLQRPPAPPFFRPSISAE